MKILIFHETLPGKRLVKKSKRAENVFKSEIEQTLSEHARNECPLGGTGDPEIPKSRNYNLFLCQNGFYWTSKKSDLKQEKPLLERFGLIWLLRFCKMTQTYVSF